MKEWTAGGAASTHVENEYNVQNAWKNLKVNYEGIDARQAIIQKARNTIQNAHFTRETTNFNFHTYCNKHLESNHDLDRFNTNIDGQSQVSAFLAGIKADQRTNPQLMAVKTTVATHPNASKNIQEAITLFKDTLIKLNIDLSTRE